MSPRTDPSVRWTVLSAVTVTVVSTLPLLLIGGLAVQLQHELSFSVVALGGAIAVYRGTGALLGVPLGRLVDRLGAALSMRLATGLVTIACLGIALSAQRWLSLAMWLVLAGSSNVLGQGGANVALAGAVPASRSGFAFGLKQSALPAAGALAGLSVPLLALTVGWRWAFVANAVMAVAAGLAVPGVGERARRRASEATNRTTRVLPLLLLTIALFFGMGAASTLSAFTVDAAVTAGIDDGTAGLLLMLGSMIAIAVRLVVGVLADRRGGRHLPVVAGMLFTGSVGYLLLALPGHGWLVAGVVVAFGAGWGFNGLFWYSVVRMNRATPGRATGIVMPGGNAGGLVGPLAFGWIVSTSGYSYAWTGAAAWGILAGGFVLLARRALLRQPMTAST